MGPLVSRGPGPNLNLEALAAGAAGAWPPHTGCDYRID